MRRWMGGGRGGPVAALPGPIADVSFLTGAGYEALTVSSTGAHDGTVGPLVADYEGVPQQAVAGFPKLLSGVRVMSGIAGSPAAGRQTEAGVGTYWSLGSGNGFSWLKPDAGAVPAPRWLGPAPARTNVSLHSTNLPNAAWTKAGTATAGTVSGGWSPFVVGSSANDIRQVQALGIGNSQRYELGLWMKLDPATTAPTMRFQSAQGASFGEWEIDISSLPKDNTPIWITRDGCRWWASGAWQSLAITILTEMSSNTSGSGGFRFFRQTSGSITGSLKGVTIVTGTEAPEFAIETTTASVTVAAETFDITGLALSADWTAIVNGVGLDASPFSAAPILLAIGSTAGSVLRIGTGGQLEAYGGTGSAVAYGSAGGSAAVAGVRRVGSQLAFRRDAGSAAPAMTGFSYTSLDAATALRIGGSVAPRRQIDRVRFWHRALSDGELLAA